MKNKQIMLSILIIAITVLSNSANAQQDTINANKTQMVHDTVKGNYKVMHPDSDHIMMQNGKMIMMKDGKSMPLTKDMTMKNGTICMVNGNCKMKDGSSSKMKEGDMMDMNGKMIPNKKTMSK